MGKDQFFPLKLRCCYFKKGAEQWASKHNRQPVQQPFNPVQPTRMTVCRALGGANSPVRIPCDTVAYRGTQRASGCFFLQRGTREVGESVQRAGGCLIREDLGSLTLQLSPPAANVMLPWSPSPGSLVHLLWFKEQDQFKYPELRKAPGTRC